MERKNKKRWIKFRHRIVTGIAYAVLAPYCRLKFGIKITPFRTQQKRQYLVVMNHQTSFDQFFIGLAFRRTIYYLATEDLFSNGWISKLIRWLVAPIPIKKQANDVQAVKTCMRVAREGGTIALAPEGNRTYSGKTAYIKPSIVKLVRALRLPLAIFRIEGGYGIQPRWSDVVRKGAMRGYVSKVIEPEEYKALSDEALYKLICDELYVNEATVSGTFRHKNLAEYLERAMYICPRCGLSEWESHHDMIHCKKCSIKVRYQPTKELECADAAFPFRFVADWYDYQCNFVRCLNLDDYIEAPAYEDTANLSEVILYKKKKPLLGNAKIALYGDKITITAPDGTQQHLPFSELSVVTVLGRNKLNIYHNDRVYQLKGSKRFNALKYVNFFYHYKNISEGDFNGEFLGL